MHGCETIDPQVFPRKRAGDSGQLLNADPMNSVVITTAVVPGFVSVLLFLVFTYLHEQSRQPYFRAWQLAWAAYTLHFALNAWSVALGSNTALELVASLLLVAMAICILV